MAFKTKQRHLHVLIGCMFATGALTMTGAALAQQKVERVEVTGSSISRVAVEGALPITTLSTEDIQKSGATSVTDLIQMLPAMQGFVPSSSSVNGGGAGVTTAALHALPSKYTLVLLDGRRVAPLALGLSQGGGYGVNLESIPIQAIERVEILTDGASAIYGSDAIAGVVNFITKKNTTAGDITFNATRPQHPGAGNWNVGISKGFGNLNSDGFNILASYSHDNQEKLMAMQRSVSAPGAYFPFSSGGTNYIFNARTGNTEPANLSFRAGPAGGALSSYAINPYYSANGNCGPNPLNGVLVSSATSTTCRFNFGSTVQDIPGSTRDSGLIKGVFKLNADTSIWGELNLSQFKMTSAFAPSAQPLVTSPTALPVIFNRYVQPFLTANNLVISGSTTVGYRSVGMGGRTDVYQTDGRHFAFGIDGTFKGWDYKASVTLSKTTLTDTAAGGYLDYDKFAAAIASGAYDPVMGTGTSALTSSVLNSQFSKADSNLNSFHFGAQHDLFQMAGGTSVLALGADLAKTSYKVGYSDLILSQSGFSTQPASSNYPVGGSYGQVPFDASRSNWGAYAELLMPVTKALEVTASARYDAYSKTRSGAVFSAAVDPVSGLQNRIADADLGNTFNSATGKLSFRFVPTDNVLLRGSYGTGFKAPNISDIAGALTFGGSTSGSYACPFPNTAGCLPGSAQYDLLAGPNGLSGTAGLKPEKSKQWTLGFRVDPSKSLSIGFDLWDVKINDQILSNGIAESVGFANPGQYGSLFVNPYKDPAGFTTIAFQQVPFNGGTAEYQGIDWDISFKTRLDFGNFSARWTGTQMLKHQYNFGPGLPFNTDLGQYGPDQGVVFRTTMNLALGLQMGPWNHILTAHYKSGYKDAPTDAGAGVFLANANGSLGAAVSFCCLDVPAYSTFDWQTNYDYNKAVKLSIGIKNLMDKVPPMSLQQGGGGNARGYDPRYADPTGRAIYIAGSYKF